MDSQKPPKKSTMRVAVPYYGTLLHPQTGMASIYFLADVDLERHETRALQLRVWNCGKQPELSQWLKEQSVAGILCRDCCNPYLRSLEENGLWVYSDGRGDAEEMVTQWMHNRVSG